MKHGGRNTGVHGIGAPSIPCDSNDVQKVLALRPKVVPLLPGDEPAAANSVELTALDGLRERTIGHIELDEITS